MRVRTTIAALVLLTGSISVARADESGTSFWLPGQSGSFAAIAPAPGFSLPLSTYLYSGGVQDNVALQHGRNLDLGVESRLLGQLIVPTYTPDIMILGARPSFSLALFPAHVSVSADARIGDISRGRSDTLSGFGDLYPK